MNRSSVSLKIFYRTLLLFLIIIALQVIFFTFMFESFHENRRIGAMQQAIHETSETVETSAAGRMETLLSRFSEDEGVYTEALDLSSETLFTASRSATFTLASREIVIPPYVERSLHDDIFEVGANIDRVQLASHVSEPIYFPVEIVIRGDVHTYDMDSDLLNIGNVFDFEGTLETHNDRLITAVERSDEHFASLQQIVVGYLVNEDTETYSYNENGREGEYFKTENAFGDYYVFITPLEVNNISYTLFTVMPIEPVYTFVSDVLLFLGITTLITLALLAGLTYLNARSIARPLKELSKAVSRIAALDFTPSVRVKGHDEIATLSKDINTMRNNLEENMKRLNAQNTRLKESLERENSLDKDRKDFIASLSHEIKTPLSVIEASSEALRDGVFETEEENQEQLRLIQQEIQKAKTLIEGIMDTYKVDRPSYLQSFKPIDLYTIVKETVQDSRPILDKNGLTETLEGEPLRIEGDHDKLRLALSNLLTNAANHTEKGGRVTIKVIKTNRDDVSLIMENAPSTMDESIIQAFDEQKTLDRASKKGTGVGLHIVRLVLDQHKAHAMFENTDEGVRFKAVFKSA